MNDRAYAVAVSGDIEDLVPTFMRNRKKEPRLLDKALSAGSVERVRRIAHRMIGAGEPYGFHRITELGRQLETALDLEDPPAIRACIAEYRAYLKRVMIVVV